MISGAGSVPFFFSWRLDSDCSIAFALLGLARLDIGVRFLARTDGLFVPIFVRSFSKRFQLLRSPSFAEFYASVLLHSGIPRSVAARLF